jgi:hypothetical protein
VWDRDKALLDSVAAEVERKQSWVCLWGRTNGISYCLDERVHYEEGIGVATGFGLPQEKKYTSEWTVGSLLCWRRSRTKGDGSRIHLHSSYVEPSERNRFKDRPVDSQ